MKNLKIFFIISLVAIMISFLGCAANTYVTSEPKGASISVNDNYKGETPIRVNVQDEIGVGSIYIFKADLDGYKSETKVFKEEGLQDPNAAIPKKIHFILKPIQASVSKYYQRVNKKEQKEEFVTHIQPQSNNISISGQRWAVIIGISEYNDTKMIWSRKSGHPVKQLLPKKNYSQKHLDFYIPKTNGDGDCYKTFRYT